MKTLRKGRRGTEERVESEEGEGKGMGGGEGGLGGDAGDVKGDGETWVRLHPIVFNLLRGGK